MKKISKREWIVLAAIACIFLASMIIEASERRRVERFHEFMEANNIEYTDGGCAYGWEQTK